MEFAHFKTAMQFRRWPQRHDDAILQRLALYRQLAAFAFCPTGEGGGIDNSCSPTGEAGGGELSGNKLGSGGYDHASAVASDPHAIRQISTTPGKRKMPWEMNEGEYNALPIVYRGGKPREGYVFVTQDQALAKIHGGGKATAFRVLPSSKLFPDPEIEGEQDRTLKGLESLKIASAVVHTNDLVPNIKFRHWKKRADLQQFDFYHSLNFREFGGLEPTQTRLILYRKLAARALAELARERGVEVAAETEDFTCDYCGLHRYHLPGEHDQCDHSPTGECVVENDPEARFGVDEATSRFFNKTVDKWVKGADRESLIEVAEFFHNFKSVRNLSISRLKADLKDSSPTKEFMDKDITVYRGGAITGDIINVTISKKIAEGFAKKAGTQISAVIVKPKNIIGYLMRPNGELLVNREDLSRVIRLDQNAPHFHCVYCGLRRYHLPGQHDQCDHSPTGECTSEESKITPEQTATLFKTGDLSESSKSTLGKYTGNFSISLNEYHRVNEADRLEAWSEKQRIAIETATKDIDAALANSKTNVALTVYRGIQLEPEDLGKLQKGDIFIDQAFVSTSRRRSIAETFARSGVLVEVKIPQGASALNARPFSREHQEEDEILLPRNARFRISDLRAVGNKHILKLEMING